MKRPSILSLFIVAAFLFVLAPGAALAIDPAHWWSKRFGDLFNDNAYSVTIDASNNVLVTGFFQGTADFGGGGLTASSLDIFLAKYDSEGVHQWSRVFGGNSLDLAYDVSVDGSGNVFIAGFFWNTIDFGGGPLTSAGGQDIFIAKFNSNGVHQWSKRFGSTQSDEASGLAVDPLGNVVLSGFFNLTVDFGGGNLTSTGDNLFLVKFDPSGVHQWSRRYGATGFSPGHGALDVAMDDAGNVLYAGWFRPTIDFGGGNLNSNGMNDVFLVKLDAAGSHQWSRRFGGAGDDKANCVDVGEAGEVTIAGTYTGTVDFGGGNLTGDGGFVATYDGAAVHQMSRPVGASAPNAVDVDAFGFISLLGTYSGTTDFGGGNRTSSGSLDVFLVQYDGAGVHQFSMSYGSTNIDIGFGLATGPGNSLVMSGYFQNTASFGGLPMTSAGVWDCFFVKLRYVAALSPELTSILDIPNDQGGQVKVRFNAAGYDVPGSPVPITQYELFLRDDPLPETAAKHRAVAAARPSTEIAPDWIYVGSVPAHQDNDYLAIATTLADSTVANGMHYSVYYVRAATSSPGLYFDSPPDSGYSLDNLAPGVPTGLVMNAGTLDWNGSTAADFDYFTVYGSSTPSFGAATVLDYTVSSSLDVSSDPYSYYFVTATDFSGNEGAAAMLDAATDVETPSRSYVLSVSSYPNPFNPSTTIRFTLPSAGRATVDIFEPAGALVRRLVDADMQAGPHTIRWNAVDGGGRNVSSGVYFARISHDGQTRSYKMVLLK